jgi:hypothetical protein
VERRMKVANEVMEEPRYGCRHRKVLAHRRRPHSLLIFLVMLQSLASCGTADDLVRVAAQHADEAGRASRVGDDITRAIFAAADTAAIRAASRIDDIADEFALDDARDALQTLAWKVTCDIVTGSIPSSTDEVASWIAAHAIDFGLTLSGDGAQLIGEAVLASTDSSEERSDAAEACSRLPESGL